MRLDIFKKLDALAPAYLTRRRSGDLVGVATHDIELIEYFFAHTVAPAFVAILIPAAVLATLFAFGWPLALAVLPFLAYAGLSPVLARARIDRLGSRAREASGEMNAHAVDTVQGLAEIVAFQQERARGVAFAARARAYVEARLPFLDDLTRQTVFQEIATGLGGLAVVATGAMLVSCRPPRRRRAAAPHLAGDVGLRARVGDRPGRPPARRHARGRPAGCTPCTRSPFP